MASHRENGTISVDPSRKLIVTARLAWAILVGIGGLFVSMWRFDHAETERALALAQKESERAQVDATWKAANDEWRRAVDRQLADLAQRLAQR